MYSFPYLLLLAQNHIHHKLIFEMKKFFLKCGKFILKFLKYEAWWHYQKSSLHLKDTTVQYYQTKRCYQEVSSHQVTSSVGCLATDSLIVDPLLLPFPKDVLPFYVYLMAWLTLISSTSLLCLTSALDRPIMQYVLQQWRSSRRVDNVCFWRCLHCVNFSKLIMSDVNV